MSAPLLTIIIPTHNRARHLGLLLNALARELHGLADKVQVIVGDNGSTDNTAAVTAGFLSDCPSAILLRHAHNIGGDANFCACLAQVRSRYFWMIGDDDLPRPGVVGRVVGLLERESVDLLYLHSEWLADIAQADTSADFGELDAAELSRTDFARQVHVWITFISGMVVNLERLNAIRPVVDTARFLGTSMVQLGWVLPLLMTGGRFRASFKPCVLATSGNTGGYQPCAVFGTNFPNAVRAICRPDSPVGREILAGLSWEYLPKLLWTTRFKKSVNFLDEDVLRSLEPLKNSLAYWLIFVPIARLPRLLAAPFLLLSMGVTRVRHAMQ